MAESRNAHDGVALYINRDEDITPCVSQQEQWTGRHMYLLCWLYIMGVLGASCNRDVGVPFPGTHWPRSQNPLLWVYNHLNELLVPAGRSSEQLYLGYTEKASIWARHVTLPQLCKTGPKSMSDKIKMGRWKKHRM